MHRKYFFLLAAQEASGQTTIAYNLGVSLCKQGKRVLIISLYPNSRLAAWRQEGPVHPSFDSLSWDDQMIPGDTQHPDSLILPVHPLPMDVLNSLLKASETFSYDAIWFLMGNPSLPCLELLAQHNKL